jgi:hypothetical protein
MVEREEREGEGEGEGENKISGPPLLVRPPIPSE